MFIAQDFARRDATPLFKPISPIETPVVLSIRWRERQIPLARGGNIRGFYPRGGGKEPLAFESLLERNVIASLLRYPTVHDLVTQPLTIRYRVGPTLYKYTPDILIEFSDLPDELAQRGFGRITLIECKPSALLHKQADTLGRAYTAMRQITSTPVLLVTDAALTVVSWGCDHDN